MKVYHEEYGYGIMIQRCQSMGVAHIDFKHAGKRIVPLEQLHEIL
jgi:hypothetical protein